MRMRPPQSFLSSKSKNFTFSVYAKGSCQVKNNIKNPRKIRTGQPPQVWKHVQKIKQHKKHKKFQNKKIGAWPTYPLKYSEFF